MIITKELLLGRHPYHDIYKIGRTVNTPVKKPNFAAQAVQFIEDRIRAGTYIPGQRLVEVDVAEESGLGIAPVREALRLLAGEGIIDLVPYRGATIRRLNRQDLRHMLETLSGIGSTGAKLAARQEMTRQDKAALQKAIKDIDNAARKGNIPALMDAAEQYHFCLHKMIGNKYLDVCLKRLHLMLFHRELASVITLENWGEYYVNFYSKLTELVEAGQDMKAAKFFADHIDFLIERTVGANAEQSTPKKPKH